MTYDQREPSMNWEPVESSQISEVGYDSDSRTLGVRFKAGARSAASEYHYADVPPQIHRAMITSSSVGSFFGNVIKNRPDLYPFTKQGELLPPAPKNPDSALLKVDKMTPEQIFVPGTMDPILEAIREEVTKQAAKLDISTKQNRSALASLAMKVTKSKTFIEGQRKNLVAAEKKRLQAIDSEGRRIWDILEGIATEVRAPLTAWEQIDKDRIARHERNLLVLLNAGKVPYGATTTDIQHWIDCVNAVDVEMEEFSALAAGHKANALKALTAALSQAQEAEAQKAENERLKAEAAERETQERAISAARFAREAAEREAEAERLRLTLEKQVAEDRAIQAERRALRAVEEERARASEAKERYAEETAKRESDKAHVAEFNQEATDAVSVILHRFQKHQSGSVDGASEAIISAIAEGHIPHITIAY